MSILIQEIFTEPVFRKFPFLAIAMILGLMPGCNSVHPSSVPHQPGTESSRNSLHDFDLVDVFEVEGRQGIATDGEYYYVSGSKALYKYSKDGELLLKNETPFADFEKPANHLGDIDVYNGEIYAGGEMFLDGRGEDIQIAIYDADTLKYKRSMNWNPDSGQVEVSGITVATDTKTIWMTDWVDGRYIYQYDLETGDYLRKLHLQPVPQYQQGIFYWDGYLYITADDGDADDDEPDNLYRVLANSSSTAEQVMLKKTFVEFKRTGEIEGLTVDPTTNEFLVLFNRGTRIVLGMPKGFYEGYDREIHEVYRYKLNLSGYGSANTAVEPAPKGTWFLRHLEMSNQAKCEDIELLLLGDSITDYWKSREADHFNKVFGQYKTANFGISADRTQHLLWRLRNGIGEGFSPKVTVLLIGTNNTGWEKDGITPRNSVSETVEGIKLVVQEIQERFPKTKLLLFALFPRDEKDDPQREQILEINRAISKLHNGTSLFFIDIHEEFLDENDEIPKTVMPDGLHPSKMGYKIWAKALRKPLQDILE